VIDCPKQQKGVEQDWDPDHDEQVKRFHERADEVRCAREEFMRERVARRKDSDSTMRVVANPRIAKLFF
jgi:hypothetical protein